MKLKKYTPDNCKGLRVGKPVISIYKGGAITLRCGAIHRMGLTADDRIILFQDHQKEMDWYIALDPKGFELRKGGHKALIFNNAFLASKILRSIGATNATSANFLIGVQTEFENVDIDGESVGKKTLSCWTIITKSAMINHNGKD